jgi:four helix bundle protein
MKTPVRSYKDLKVWGKAMDLVVESYRIARLLPKIEVYGLTSQIQRAATSIPANIAEGHGREHLGEYLRHLSIASGSLTELETHLLITNKLFYVQMKELEPALGLAAEVGRMLAGLTKSLKSRYSTPQN